MKIFPESDTQEACRTPFRAILKNENGAADLASVITGVIVMGIAGSVVAATLLGAVPWFQNNAAKQQLSNIVIAQNTFAKVDDEGDFTRNIADLVDTDSAGVVLESNNVDCYAAFKKSGSGKSYYVTNKQTAPQLVPSTWTRPANYPTNCMWPIKPTSGAGLDYGFSSPVSGVVETELNLKADKAWTGYYVIDIPKAADESKVQPWVQVGSGGVNDVVENSSTTIRTQTVNGSNNWIVRRSGGAGPQSYGTAKPGLHVVAFGIDAQSKPFMSIDGGPIVTEDWALHYAPDNVRISPDNAYGKSLRLVLVPGNYDASKLKELQEQYRVH